MDADTVKFGSLNSINLNFEQKKTRFSLRMLRKNIAMFMTVIILFSLLLIISLFAMYHAPKLDPTGGVPHTEPELHVLNRTVWNAEERNLPLLDRLDTIVIAHTDTEPCATQGECIDLIRNLQAAHIYSRHKPDIAYNFLVGGDGQIYEGTGWDKQADNSRGYNNHSLYLAFIGSFDKISPSVRQLSAAKLFMKTAVEEKKVIETYMLHGQIQVSGSSSSPGVALYAMIRTWDHFKDLE